MKFKKKLVTINHKKVFYWEKNKSEKLAVVFLHGFPGSHKGIIEMADKIENCRLIVPDLPGCGESDPLKEKHILKNYAKWLNDFLDTLLVEKIVVVGHSFGARLALMFGIYYSKRVEKLVLITPVTKADSLIAKLATIDYNFTGFLPPYMQKAWLFNPIYRKAKNIFIYESSSVKRRKHLISIEDDEIKKVNARANIELFNEFYQNKSILLRGKINIKTLIIACDKDQIATLNSVKELYNRFTYAEIKIMKNSGHLVVPERPSAVGNIVNKWLKIK